MKPHPETLLIDPFKSIWNRDESEGKGVAIAEFAFIEFFSSARASNPFKGYPESERAEKIVERTFLKYVKGWEPDALIEEGIEHWEQYQTDASSSYRLYSAAKQACDNLADVLSNIDATVSDDKGRPIYKPRDITGALKDIDVVATKLAALKKKVEEELYEDSRMRSNKEISPLADPSSLR